MKYVNVENKDPKQDPTVILIVDDDLSTRSLVGSILRDSGFEILSARDSGDATDKVLKSNRTVHLLITNVILTDGDGFELSDNLRKHQPHLKTLFMSGFTASSVGAIHGETFICKPFRVSEMQGKVREILGLCGLSSQSRH